MALKVYIAYGIAADQVNALRLQALGAVNGLSVYVPPAYTRQDPSASLDPHSEAYLRGADVVLGLIAAAMSDTCRWELDLARSLGKSTIVLADPGPASRLEPYFSGSVVVINPGDPAKTELDIVQFLKKAEMEQDSKKALIALA